uniref:WGS project CAEQ00000000 data, annotated contig 1776 n=1 Tax=Trypanosoma congolense (strain IL3000) TaxID=1068625 RepID=F9W8T7_TRYCI|nr:unnamed protein product [Trypanosoma congolense IL3000]
MEWIDGESLLRGPEDREGWGLIPVFPPSVWNEIPHFLRTNLAGDVPNLNWSGEDVAALLYEFFSRYDALRDACRTVRDSRMFVPRVYQLFERIEHSLVRLDATVSETLESVENVPFGYVVSFFISNFLRSHTSASPHRNLLQPGTVISVYSTSSSTSPVEMEFTKMSYNLWYASHRHKSSQPLCYLFVNVLEGRLPLQIFGLMTRVLRNVENTISKSDTEGSNLFSYNKLVSIVLKLVGDMDAQVGRCAVLAVAEMFKVNDLPLMGGKINTYDISADEATLASTERRLTNRSPVRHAHHSKSDSSFGQAFKGASVLTCFWRRLVIRSHERVYDIMESILGPMVLESQVVVGLFVLPIGSSMAALRAFDDNKLTPSREYLQSACPFMRERARSRCTSPSGSDAPQLRPTAVHFNMDRVERTAFIQSIKDISFSDVFSEVLKKVHLIGTNIHFPNDGVEELQPSSLTTDVGVEKTARSRSSSPKKRPRRTKKGGVVNQKKIKEKSPRKNVADATPRSVDMASEKVEELVPMNLVVKSDKELVEWYNFCAVLRQTQLNFSSSIFHNES